MGPFFFAALGEDQAEQGDGGQTAAHFHEHRRRGKGHSPRKQGEADEGGHPEAGVEHGAQAVAGTPLHIELHAHTGQNLHKAQADAQNQQHHRVGNRIDELGHGPIDVEKGFGDGFRRVAEEAAEHQTPENGGHLAVAEQPQIAGHGLLGAAFAQQEGRAQNQQQTVTGVGQHHAEKQVIKEADHRRGVDIAGQRHGVHFGYGFGRGGESVVIQLDRGLPGISVLCLQHTRA